jgi:outer membrane protein assembly factor BamB
VLGAPGSVFAANYQNAYINGGSEGNTLLDFNTNTQAITWQLSGDYAYTPAYNAGVLYAANNNPLRLEARRESDGSLLWSWTPPQAGDTTFDSEVLLTSSMIFVSTNLATYGIDATTHQLVFSYPFPGRLALSQNGILYIQGTGPIVAINVK